jgi:hypothetical protein
MLPAECGVTCHRTIKHLHTEFFTMLLLADVTEQSKIVIQSGVSLGAVLAVVCSWQRNRSILWAILAGIFSWFSVIYFALTRLPEETK